MSDELGSDSMSQEVPIGNQESELSNQQHDDPGQRSVFYIDFDVVTPDNVVVRIPNVSITEPVGALKQILLEYLETCFYTSFSLAFKNEDESFTKVHEFAEISTFVADASPKSQVLYIVLEEYDVKLLRHHIKKLREIVSNPPVTKGSLSKDKQTNKLNETNNQESLSVNGPEDVEETTKLIQYLATPEMITSRLKLSDFYRETLYRTGKYVDQLSPSGSANDHSSKSTIPSLSSAIKLVTISGWNPPPSYRRLQGDLMYIEVVIAEEGTFNITGTSSGFYVNSSTVNSFDPRPSSSNNYFSHELFALILQISPSIRHVWSLIYKAADQGALTQSEFESNTGALNLIATYYGKGKHDQIQLIPQWNVPVDDMSCAHDSTGLTPGYQHKKHSYDINRVFEDLSDNYGIEERGSAREWNDEIQSMRDMKTSTIQHKVTKAKFCHKITSEFVDAAKALVQGILDGHISPLNLGENETNLIYVYNGIFVSRAVDTKDTFRVCIGEEASRKAAAHDLNNQKQITSLGIDGLSTVLTVLIDIKGERFVAQSIIPGVLSPGANSARLAYGVLEPGKRICYKTFSQSTVEAMQKKLHLKNSEIPIVVDVPETVVDAAGDSRESQPLIGEFLSQLDSEKGSPIRVDDLDEVFSDPDAKIMRHCGPIEGKLLKGSDDRIYALDMIRFTPLDANFVKGDRGTGNIPEERLKHSRDDLLVVYILRHELVSSFIQTKLNVLRQNVLLEAAKQQRELRNQTNEKQESSGSDETANQDSNDSTDPLNDVKFTEEVLKQYNAITPESVSLQINPNVFLPTYIADVNPSEVQKDEAIAKELANYLYQQVLPSITQQIRTGDLLITDNSIMIDMLHNNGVNIRYLGELALLAQHQEDEDVQITQQGKQRIQSMPLYWLELLEIEMIARAVKHMFRWYYQSNKRVQAAPSATIVSVLNHIFGSSTDVSLVNPVVSSDATNETNKPSTVSKSAKKRQKAKAAMAALTMKASISSAIPDLVDGTKDRQSTWIELLRIVRERFCYEPKLVGGSAGSDGPTLSTRINRLTLLRRICQINGLRITNRDYQIGPLGAAVSNPFSINDILAIVPIVKSCESEANISDVRDLIIMSRSLLQEKNLQGSFEYAQEANHWIQQIVGPVHREVLLPVDQMTGIFITAGDYLSALGMALKALLLSVQIYGLDSHETLQHHLQLAMIYMELSHYKLAVQHLYTSRYLSVLLAGDHHPELSSIYNHLGMICKEMNNNETALVYYQLARTKVADLNKHSLITENVADVYMSLGRLDDALREQRVSYNVVGGILGQEDPKTSKSKDRMEKFRRAVTERNVAAAMAQRQQQETMNQQPTTNGFKDDNGPGHGNGTALHGDHKRNGKKSNHRSYHHKK